MRGALMVKNGTHTHTHTKIGSIRAPIQRGSQIHSSPLALPFCASIRVPMPMAKNGSVGHEATGLMVLLWVRVCSERWVDTTNSGVPLSLSFLKCAPHPRQRRGRTEALLTQKGIPHSLDLACPFPPHYHLIPQPGNDPFFKGSSSSLSSSLSVSTSSSSSSSS